jgi:peptidoglycan/xylan/chitin deacetylase (PgdA/CDA1 family)
MRWLRDQGSRTLDLPVAWTVLTSGADVAETVVVPFDDGRRDFYTEAMHLLTQCGFTATVIRTTDRVRQTSARIQEADNLTWSEVCE